MNEIYLDVTDEKYFDVKNITRAIDKALKVTTKWLSQESIKRFGTKYRIRSTAGRRRVKINRIKNGKSGVWYGLRPISLAYVRDYSQEPDGVQSGEHFYKGAFAQAISGTKELIWRRKRERPKETGKRTRSPNGTRKPRKSPTPEIVREDFAPEIIDDITALEHETYEKFKEAFLNAMHNQ